MDYNGQFRFANGVVQGLNPTTGQWENLVATGANIPQLNSAGNALVTGGGRIDNGDGMVTLTPGEVYSPGQSVPGANWALSSAAPGNNNTISSQLSGGSGWLYDNLPLVLGAGVGGAIAAGAGAAGGAGSALAGDTAGTAAFTSGLSGANLAGGGAAATGTGAGMDLSDEFANWLDSAGGDLGGAASDSAQFGIGNAGGIASTGTEIGGPGASPSLWQQISSALSGNGSSLLKGAGSLLSGSGGGGGAGGGSLLGTILGALVGSQNKIDPITQSSAPWNAGYFGPLQNQTLQTLGSNQLNLPGVPQMPTMPDYTSDAYVQQAIQNALIPLAQSYTDPGGPMAAIRSDFGQAGQYGGTRQGVAEGVAAGRYGQAAGNVTAQMANSTYNTNLGARQNAFNANSQNSQWMYDQAAQQALQKFTAPWTSLSNAGNIFTGAAGRGQTTTTNIPSQNPLISALGGAISGSKLGSQLGY